MSLYLHDIPLPDARLALETALKEYNLWRILGVEEIPLDENALGRVLAEPIWAKISSPHYNASAMDGYAVRSVDTNGAAPGSPLLLAVGQSARYLDTGDPLPSDFDAVIPIENVEPLDLAGNISSDMRQPNSIRIRAAVAPWSHIRPLGEDIVATELVFAAGHVLRPVDLGAAAAAGYKLLRVARPPQVAILPTGSELVPIGSDLVPGQILEYNSLVIAAQLRQMGAQSRRYEITNDSFDLIKKRVTEAARTCDLILINAGSSAGSEDFTEQVVRSLGELLFHGVAVRPGHPVIAGLIRLPDASEHHRPSMVPILGVPGYPVSAALTIEIFVEPLIARWLGRSSFEAPVVQAQMTRKLTSPGGDDDYVRVIAGKVNNRLLAAPLPRGAGVISSLVRADGIVIVPRGAQGVEAGERIDVHLYRPATELDRTIFCIGSHDISLDLLAQFLAARGRRLVSANVGSLGGLIALSRGESHLGGSHLLDPATGEYNISYIARYLPGREIRVIALAGREQGLMVARTNPKNIRSLADLPRPDLTFINRQRGAGTRVLLDYWLSQQQINPNSIRGYDDEEYSHLTVAATIASGRADCGLGISAAAMALNLDFVPLFSERYDLVIPEEQASSGLLFPLLEILAGSEFRTAVSALPGYDVSVMGKIIPIH